MSIVYPQLKPMLEASIRKLSVTVNWHEGLQKRDITVVQYVTRPMRAPALPSGAASGAPSLFGAPGSTGFPAPSLGGRKTTGGVP
jgi:hypothetical protein